MNLRKNSLLARAYFFSLYLSNQNDRAFLERNLHGTDVCRMFRRVFLWLPLQLLLYGSAIGAALFGFGFVFLYKIPRMLWEGWFELVLAAAGLPALILSWTVLTMVAIVLAHLFMKTEPGRIIKEYAKSVKDRYCAVVYFTEE